MGWKDFFIVDKKSFILFVVFATFVHLGLFELTGLFQGIHFLSFLESPLEIFNLFEGWAYGTLNVTSNAQLIFYFVWDFILSVSIFVLNIFWQLFLANVIIILYYKLRQGNR